MEEAQDKEMRLVLASAAPSDLQQPRSDWVTKTTWDKMLRHVQLRGAFVGAVKASRPHKVQCASVAGTHRQGTNKGKMRQRCAATLEQRARAIDQAAARGNEAPLCKLVQSLSGRKAERGPRPADPLQDVAGIVEQREWREQCCEYCGGNTEPTSELVLRETWRSVNASVRHHQRRSGLGHHCWLRSRTWKSAALKVASVGNTAKLAHVAASAAQEGTPFAWREGQHPGSASNARKAVDWSKLAEGPVGHRGRRRRPAVWQRQAGGETLAGLGGALAAQRISGPDLSAR